MEKRHLIFVYGTLKTKGGNASLLNGSTYLGSARTATDMSLWSNGIPFLTLDPQGPVRGELYAVSDRTLDEIDWLEGHGLSDGYTRTPLLVVVEEPSGHSDLVQGEERFAQVYLWLQDPPPGAKLLTAGVFKV